MLKKAAALPCIGCKTGDTPAEDPGKAPGDESGENPGENANEEGVAGRITGEFIYAAAAL